MVYVKSQIPVCYLTFADAYSAYKTLQGKSVNFCFYAHTVYDCLIVNV